MNTSRLASLQNVALLMEMAEQVSTRGPGIGLFFGEHGAGKTSATTLLQNVYGATVVQAKETWVLSDMLTEIGSELGIRDLRGTGFAKIKKIAETLLLSDGMLVIDDAQYLRKGKMMGAARDIFETCHSPLILVGEPALEASVTHYPNIYDRVLVSTETVPCNLSDARALANIYAERCEIPDDILSDLLDATGGSARKIRINCERIQQAALAKGTRIIDRQMLNKVKLHTVGPVSAQVHGLRGDKRGAA